VLRGGPGAGRRLLDQRSDGTRTAGQKHIAVPRLFLSLALSISASASTSVRWKVHEKADKWDNLLLMSETDIQLHLRLLTYTYDL